MSEPLLTDEQLAEAALAPKAASDDSGAVTMHGLTELVDAQIKLADHNRKNSRLNVGKVLAFGKMLGVPKGD